MNELNRSSDETQEMATIKMLGNKLAESMAELAKWSVGLQAVIDPDTLDLVVTMKKPNGTGFIKTVPKAEVLYYSNDPATLIEILTDLIYENLLKPQIKAEISTVIANSVRNVSKMSSVK